MIWREPVTVLHHAALEAALTLGGGARWGVGGGVRHPRLSLPGQQGVTLELCAGIVDKPGLALEQVAREEVRPVVAAGVTRLVQVLEETGYSVAACRLHHIITCPAGVGTAGSSQALYWLEVNHASHILGSNACIKYCRLTLN